MISAVTEEIAVMSMVISMLIVLLLAWKWTHSFRTAFIIMLITGKVWAGIMYVFGIDRPLFNIVMYNKIRHVSSTITITADQFIFLSFLGSLLFALLWPILQPSLPPWISRGFQIFEGGEKK